MDERDDRIGVDQEGSGSISPSRRCEPLIPNGLLRKRGGASQDYQGSWIFQRGDASTISSAKVGAMRRS